MWDLFPYNIHSTEGAMNTIRCCISCILPCGALDVIRVVHSNGHVEEITGTVKASEIMKAYPKHVLKKPSTSSDQEDVVPKIVVVPPDALLQRGKIYFLVPVISHNSQGKSRSSSAKKKKRSSGVYQPVDSNKNDAVLMSKSLLTPDQYLSDILSERASTQRERRRGRVGIWRPHLESICESPNCM